MSDNEAILLKNEDEEEIKPIIVKKQKENIAFRFAKRTIDIIAGVVGTILLIPITILVWLVRIIKKENNGPLFFEQLRIGKNGKQFRMYKYRSMCMNADETLKKYLEENEDARKEYKKYKKLKNDPRITKVGCFLRKTSLDEFPQFINVLKGEMSLVGTRPPTVEEYETYEFHHHARLACKPGLTGMWQVNGRSNITDFEEVVKLDTKYINEWSIGLDLQILLKTIVKVLKKEGAI